ncbi:hypothetical protein CR513_27732, partial [Mucuna pruriens]
MKEDTLKVCHFYMMEIRVYTQKSRVVHRQKEEKDTSSLEALLQRKATQTPFLAFVILHDGLAKKLFWASSLNAQQRIGILLWILSREVIPSSFFGCIVRRLAHPKVIDLVLDVQRSLNVLFWTHNKDTYSSKVYRLGFGCPKAFGHSALDAQQEASFLRYALELHQRVVASRDGCWCKLGVASSRGQHPTIRIKGAELEPTMAIFAMRHIILFLFGHGYSVFTLPKLLRLLKFQFLCFLVRINLFDRVWSLVRKLIRNAYIPHSKSFISWRLLHNRMSAYENLRLKGCIIVSICNLCGISYESSAHLFLNCNFAQDIWHWFIYVIKHDIDLSSFQSIFSICSLRTPNQSSIY